MTPEQIEELARQIESQGLPIDWKVYVVMWLLALVGAAVGAAIAGYYSKRGEIKAIHDQIEKVEEQTRRITNVVEREKSLAWLEQKRWDLKRDFYWEILATINALSSALRELRNVFKFEGVMTPEQVQSLVSLVNTSTKRVMEREDALIRILGVGRILLTDNVVELLDSYQQDLQQIEKGATALMSKYQRPKKELEAMTEAQREAHGEQFITEYPKALRQVIDNFREKHKKVMSEIIRAARNDLLAL